MRKHQSKKYKREAKRKWRKERPVENKLVNLRARAKKLGVPCTLTVDELREFCQRTGYMSKRGRMASSGHIDRIIDELGYVYNNIQILSNAENISKENKRRVGKTWTPVDIEPF